MGWGFDEPPRSLPQGAWMPTPRYGLAEVGHGSWPFGKPSSIMASQELPSSVWLNRTASLREVDTMPRTGAGGAGHRAAQSHVACHITRPCWSVRTSRGHNTL